jgi:hypothetical protein
MRAGLVLRDDALRNSRVFTQTRPGFLWFGLYQAAMGSQLRDGHLTFCRLYVTVIQASNAPEFCHVVVGTERTVERPRTAECPGRC